MTPQSPQTDPKTPKTPAPAPAPSKKRLELNSKNLSLLLIAGLAVTAVLFVAVMIMGLSVLGGKSKSLVDLKAQSQSLDSELLNLAQAKKDVQKYAYFKQVAKTVIPNDKDQAEAVSEIFQFAQAAGIKIQNITFPTSSLGLTTATVGTTSTADATASTSTSKAITQAKPVTSIPGLYSLELTITPQTGHDVPASFQVTYPKVLAFLKSIEDNRRTAQITQVIILPPSSSSDSLSFTLTTNIFIKP
jgi:hypothetical protein